MKEIINLPMGVYFDDKNETYTAFWQDKDGKCRSKHYGIGIYWEKARNPAIATRKEAEESGLAKKTKY